MPRATNTVGSGRRLQVLSITVASQCEGVHQLGEAEQIGFLTKVAEAVRFLQVQRVLEAAVYGLGVTPGYFRSG